MRLEALGKLKKSASSGFETATLWLSIVSQPTETKWKGFGKKLWSPNAGISRHLLQVPEAP
jgi:hypothetical protein